MNPISFQPRTSSSPKPTLLSPSLQRRPEMNTQLICPEEMADRIMDGLSPNSPHIFHIQEDMHRLLQIEGKTLLKAQNDKALEKARSKYAKRYGKKPLNLWKAFKNFWANLWKILVIKPVRS
jgi:hypothetical protein